MKNSGLKNRFSQKTRYVWLYWYDCMICGKNRIDALHHIISPSCRHYIKGKHNESVLNSCPIHNFVCHLDNEAYLFKDETVTHLLNKVYDALTTELDYCLNENDKEYIKVYGHLYEGNVIMEKVGIINN